MVPSMQHFKKASACKRWVFFFLGHIFCDNSLFLLLEASHKMSFPSSGRFLDFSFLPRCMFLSTSLAPCTLFSWDASRPVGRYQLDGECCKVEYPTRHGLFTQGSDSFVSCTSLSPFTVYMLFSQHASQSPSLQVPL